MVVILMVMIYHGWKTNAPFLTNKSKLVGGFNPFETY